MTKDDLELAVLRHATSKLDEDDLLNINSLYSIKSLYKGFIPSAL